MESEFDLSLLRTFVAIVETGGLTTAGRVVGRTQPAVSHQAKRLECAVGRPIFGSDKRHLTLTREGEILLGYARNMLKLNDELRARFASPEVEGRVRLGTVLPVTHFEAASAFSWATRSRLADSTQTRSSDRATRQTNPARHVASP